MVPILGEDLVRSPRAGWQQLRITVGPLTWISSPWRRTSRPSSGVPMVPIARSAFMLRAGDGGAGSAQTVTTLDVEPRRIEEEVDLIGQAGTTHRQEAHAPPETAAQGGEEQPVRDLVLQRQSEAWHLTTAFDLQRPEPHRLAPVERALRSQLAPSALPWMML